jgi:polyribonucleotide nucleotidyltransferase
MSEDDRNLDDDDDVDEDMDERLDTGLNKMVRINRLSERANNILKQPELANSIEDTDPVWNELFEYVNEISSPLIEKKITIEDKIEIVRNWLFADPEIEQMLSPL